MAKTCGMGTTVVAKKAGKLDLGKAGGVTQKKERIEKKMKPSGGRKTVPVNKK